MLEAFSLRNKNFSIFCFCISLVFSPTLNCRPHRERYTIERVRTACTHNLQYKPCTRIGIIQNICILLSLTSVVYICLSSPNSKLEHNQSSTASPTIDPSSERASRCLNIWKLDLFLKFLWWLCFYVLFVQMARWNIIEAIVSLDSDRAPPLATICTVSI